MGRACDVSFLLHTCNTWYSQLCQGGRKCDHPLLHKLLHWLENRIVLFEFRESDDRINYLKDQNSWKTLYNDFEVKSLLRDNNILIWKEKLENRHKILTIFSSVLSIRAS